MRNKITLVTVCSVLIVFLLVSPWILGIYVQQHYQRILNFYNAKGDIKAEIKQYQRGWFTSDVILSVKILNPDFFHFFNHLGIPSPLVPKDYLFKQHIQHGPIVYRYPDDLSSLFGLAAIQNKITITPKLTQFFHQLGLKAPFLQQNEDFITFNGKYDKHFKTAPFEFIYPQTDIHIQSKGLEGHVAIWPTAFRVGGYFAIQNTKISDIENSILISDMTLLFDQYKSPENLWLGTNQFLISELKWHDISGKMFSISNLNFNGNAEEKSGELSGKREFKIDRLQFDDMMMGPMRFQVSVDKLNASAMTDLVVAYQDITQRGELYKSQLQQKMLSLFPRIINPGSILSVDELRIKTPDGKLWLKGKLLWPKNRASPEDISELLDAVNATVEIRISKKLADQFIRLASEFSLMNQSNQEIRDAYRQARQQMIEASRQNTLILDELINAELLGEDDALMLLSLQKEWVSVDEYNSEIKKIFLDKKISLATSYQLAWQYAEVQRPYDQLEKIIKLNQEAIAAGMHNQLSEWIHQHYIHEDSEEYSLSLSREDGELKANRKHVNK